MTLILDAGALIAVDRGDRTVAALLKRERLAGGVPVTHGGVVGQVWRGSARQAQLARLLNATEIVSIDEDLGRRVGALLSQSRTSDVIDAAVCLLARDGDEILTSDAGDLGALCSAAYLSVDLIAV
jgi:hypothetical protein